MRRMSLVRRRGRIHHGLRCEPAGPGQRSGKPIGQSGRGEPGDAPRATITRRQQVFGGTERGPRPTVWPFAAACSTSLRSNGYSAARTAAARSSTPSGI